MNKIVSLILLLQFFLIRQVRAQEELQNLSVPIPFETMIGNNRFTTQIFVNRYFDKKNKVNLISVTSSAAAYNNDLKDLDFINKSFVGYELTKGFGVTAGISINAKIGFSPTAGVEYVFNSPIILFVIAPDVYLTNTHNIEGLSVLEYKLKFRNGWGLYTRLQGLYSYNPKEGYHERSYVNVRIGPSFKQFAFGVGSNDDWYGSMKFYKENYGIFLRYSFL